jgi:glycosyltransferase involved in cell wall biosynthesis
MEYLESGHSVVLVSPGFPEIEKLCCIHAQNREQALLAIPRDVDIVHFHGWAPDTDFDLPWIYTLHGNCDDLSVLPRNTVCISADHADRHQKKVFVYNGIDPSEVVYQERKQDHLLFFSLIRMKAKGADSALRIARKYHLPMVFCGGSRLDLIKVGGLMDSFSPGIRFAGKVVGMEKAQYFANAKALLFPIRWPEPFGLVLIESLMSGTPVIAKPLGSVPELIPPEVGALFTDDDSFLQALDHIRGCSPRACRDWAMSRFTTSECASGYVALFERMLNGEDPFC